MSQRTHWQYQGKAEVVSTDGERITPDKWLPSKPDFSRRKTITVASIATSLFFVDIVGAIPTVDRWYQQPSEPVRVQKNTNDYQGLFVLPEQQPLPPTASWLVQQSTPVYVRDRRHEQQSSFGEFIDAIDVAEEITPDKWHPLQNQPVLDKAHNQYLYQNFFFTHVDALAPEAISVDKWYQLPSQPLFDSGNRVYKYQFFAGDFIEAIVAEVVTPDKWHPDIEQPLFKKAPRYFHPSLFITHVDALAPEVIRIDKWRPELPDFARHKPRQPHFYSYIRFTPLVPEVITPDKWHPETQQPYFPKPHLGYLFPVTILEPPVPADVTIDRWFRQTETPLSLYTPRRVAEFPAYTVDPTVLLIFTPPGERIFVTRVRQFSRETIIPSTGNYQTISAIAKHHLKISLKAGNGELLKGGDVPIGVAFRPDQVGGLAIWLDAGRETYQDSAFTTAADTDTDVVGGWKDLSGNGRHVTQTTTSLKPLYRTGFVNSRPAIRFDGSDDRLEFADDEISTGITYFLVARFHTDLGSTFQYIVGTRDGAGNFSLNYEGTGDNFQMAAVEYAHTIDTSAFVVWNGEYQGADSTVYESNTLKATGDSLATTFKNIRIGRTTDFVGFPAACDVAEFIVYNPIISGSKRQQVTNYLRDKYNIT